MIEKICKIISNKTAKFPLGFGEKCITWLNGWRMIGHRDGYGMNRWRRQVDLNDNTLGIKTPAWSLRKKQEFSLHTHPNSTLTKKGDYSRGILCIICLWPNNRISSIDSWKHRQRVLKDLCLNTGNHTQETKTYQLAALMLFKNSIQENEDVYFAKYRKWIAFALKW